MRPIKAKALKRFNNLYSQIISIDNLRLADQRARRGKQRQYGITLHDKTREANILLLNDMLINKRYKTSKYKISIIYEPKEREVYKLPYFPDRIVHHAINNIAGKLFVSWFTADTYSCIKGRGTRAAAVSLKKALKEIPKTTYCLKLDIKKFYPSVNQEILKNQLRRKIKDNDLLWLLDEIIDSAPGIPIGNLLSGNFANFYLTPFDHWIKQEQGVRHYFRYMDDLVILSDNKEDLHKLLFNIKTFLKDNLKLEVKKNYQVFPVADRGIDFVGYRFFHDHILLRKGIKKSFARAIKKGAGRASIASYYGWTTFGNTINLRNKLLGMTHLKPLKQFNEFGIEPTISPFTGEKIKLNRLFNQKIKVIASRIRKSDYPDKGNGMRLEMQIEHAGEIKVTWTGSVNLQNMISKVSESDYPFETTIVTINDQYEFR